MKSANWSTLIVNAQVVKENETIRDGYVAINGEGRIAAAGPMDGLDERQANTALQRVDAAGSWLLPGFIDVHVHGGYGYDFMEATKEAIDGITKFHNSQGTTTLLATTVTQSREAIEAVLRAADAYRKAGSPYARLGGVHLEGPFISPKWPGAQNPSFIVDPQADWLDAWTEEFPGLIRMMTLAPERENALPLIRRLTDQGIVASAGHTDATYDQMVEATRYGLRHAVHTFNAMTGLHHRNPGVVGAVLTEEVINAEVIADGHHVHPAAIKLLTLAKRKDNLLLITDAMSAAGLGSGEYDLGGLPVIVEDGVARLKAGNTLAGSTLTMIQALRFMVEQVGLSVEEASRLASHNPAKAIGCLEQTGTISEGKLADLLLVSPQLQIGRVWVEGHATTSE
ncbi:N-acetylglucosamine-6-phosphate deacetylase [Paenibacillus sp. EPM92]|uniref:N-acetylglucosamine-6-phosphate deacetylase n=1 Tax=Paenibacillus sp. EPM92 TaxID=1561195 RepID=UPI001915FA4B|nr:N-acetylglucosamine-6-phosphate deacetylase [Paenibacillus sp. EPM92]